MNELTNKNKDIEKLKKVVSSFSQRKTPPGANRFKSVYRLTLILFHSIGYVVSE